jgi:hypothetical protein
VRRTFVHLTISITSRHSFFPKCNNAKRFSPNCTRKPPPNLEVRPTFGTLRVHCNSLGIAAEPHDGQNPNYTRGPQLLPSGFSKHPEHHRSTAAPPSFPAKSLARGSLSSVALLLEGDGVLATPPHTSFALETLQVEVTLSLSLSLNPIPSLIRRKRGIEG